MKKYFYILIALISISCSDLLDVKPSSEIDSSEAFETINDLSMAVNGAYEHLTSASYYQGKFLVMADLMADDFMNPIISSGHLTTFYNYIWNEKNVYSSFYTNLYYCIANINDVIQRSTKLKDEEGYNQLIAQLKCLRALHHFNLVKIYGPLYANLGKGKIKENALGITIKTVIDKTYGHKFERNTVKEVYEFIVEELEANIDNLPDNAKGYLSKDAVKLLLARLYLYMGDVKFKDVDNNYAKALSYVQDLVSDSSPYKLITKDNYVDSWREDYNSESIFEFPVTEDDNVGNNSIGYYVLPTGSGYKEVCATADFMALQYEDVRFDLLVKYTQKEIDYFFPTEKFRGKNFPYVNNIKILRLSEAYLIAAECELKLINPTQAGKYLTELRKNRTDVEPNKYLTSVSMDDVLFERRLELFCEGHRAYDLWRNQLSVIRYTNQAEKTAKGHSDMSSGIIEFDNHKTIYPIHEQEMFFALDKNQQNPNY